jgi:regulator of cell morphogenesis and NO signaling
MTTIALDDTLADLVTAEPSLARELERRGLDYCCGGRQTLEQACLAHDLDPATVAEELIAIAGPHLVEAWTTMDASELVDHIETTHHRYLWEELPRLTALADRVRTVHSAQHPELDDVARCFDELRAELVPHLLKEERVLFPMIRELSTATEPPEFLCGSIRSPMAVMMREHDQAGDLLARLRRLTDGFQPPADACASYTALYVGLSELEADTHLHVHKENNVLFPMVTSLAAALGC